jgi:lambda family phage portal protein
VAYHFLNQHPGEYSFSKPLNTRNLKRTRVPADEVIHLFIQERPGQTRGTPALVSAMIRLRHMHGYEEAEIIFARASASLMGFIESDADQLQGDAVAGGQQVTDFEPGIFKQMRPGEKVNVPAVSRPGGQFDPFMRAMLRGVASGTGVAYTSVSADYSQSNYSSERAAILKERDLWRVLQDWVRDNFHQEVFEGWLSMAFLSNQISLPKYEVTPELYTEATKWCPRGWAWIDPEKEVSAYEKGVAAGFITQGDVIAQDGGDFNEKMLQRSSEVKKAQSLGLVFSSDHSNSQAMASLKAAEIQAAAFKASPKVTE